MNSFASIYIPRMSIGWTEEAIKGFMSDIRIGSVSHVDFTPINKKPGFGENVDSVVKSAFIHFSNPIIGADDKYHFRSNNYLINSFWVTIENGQSYKLNVPIGGYWICLKNKNPVQRTMMNIHQVVENGRYLENLITEQAEEIKKLKDTVDGLHHTVYQLLGGLYCQHSQGGILNLHLKTIGLGSGDGRTSDDDTHPSGIWPTTRQGDENSQRIEKLEHFISNINNVKKERIAKNMYDEYESFQRAAENIERRMNELPDSQSYDIREELRNQAKIIHTEKIILNNRFTELFGCSINYYKDKLINNEKQDEALYDRKHSVQYSNELSDAEIEEIELFFQEEEERKQGRRDIIEERW